MAPGDLGTTAPGLLAHRPRPEHPGMEGVVLPRLEVVSAIQDDVGNKIVSRRRRRRQEGQGREIPGQGEGGEGSGRRLPPDRQGSPPPSLITRSASWSPSPAPDGPLGSGGPDRRKTSPR